MTSAATGFSHWTIDTVLTESVQIFGSQNSWVYLEVKEKCASSREEAGDVNEITFNFVYTDKPCCKKVKHVKNFHQLSIWPAQNWCKNSKTRWSGGL